MNNPGGKHFNLPEAVPVVAIYNNLETFYPFLARLGDASILETRKFRGDRALFWLGREKLVFCSSGIPDAPAICQRYGYTATQVATPEKATLQLSLDIAREPQLVEAILRHAGPGKHIQLVPYASTRELYFLAEHLTSQYGLTVDLPESPAELDFWVRDFIDTKHGFRQLVAGWIDDAVRLPQGFAVPDLGAASAIIAWFLQRGMDCVVKPDRGESGLGIQFFDHRLPHPDLLAELQSNDFIDGEFVVVEEYIVPQAGLSPSLEMFVPPLGTGEPQVTYLSNQHFGSLARFSGVIISRDYQEATWYPGLVENGLRIAARLQSMGYTGHFDLDAVVDAHERVYLLEINARRTGGTHTHEFGRFAFGEHYLEEVALFSTNRVDSRGISSLDALFETLAPVLFPIQSEARGVVVTVTSTLYAGDFGCLVAGRDVADVMAIKERMEALLQQAVLQPVPWVEASV